MRRTHFATCLSLVLCAAAFACGDDNDSAPGSEPSGKPGGGSGGGGTGASGEGGSRGEGNADAGTRGDGINWGSLELPSSCGAPTRGAEPPGNVCPSSDPVPLKTTRVGTGFDVALFVTSLPGDPSLLIVVERRGTIQTLDPATGEKKLFFDLETRPRGHALLAALSAQGEQGLLGLAFHPNFPKDRRFFVNYTARADHDVTVVSSFEVRADAPDQVDVDSEQSLLEFEQPQGNHNGGMVAFGPDGCLFVGSGDGGEGNDVGPGHAPGGNGQSLATNLGKVLRLDVDKPTERPVGNLESASVPHVWNYGMRNPWRFSFDRLTGDLYVGDVGQGGVEEVDVEPRGSGNANYGWPIMEGSGCLSGNECERSGLVLPTDEYDNGEGHDCVIGGYVYRGENIPSLRGWYVYGDNGAASNGKVATFVWDGDGRCKDSTVQLQERDKLALDSEITSFGEDASGELYIVTRSSVYRLDAR